MPYVKQPNGSWILVDEDGNRQGDGTVKVSTAQQRLDRAGVDASTAWADDPGLTEQQRAALRAVGRSEVERARQENPALGGESNGMDRDTGQQLSQMPDVNAIYNAVFGRDATADEVSAWGPELQRRGLDADSGAKAIFDAAYEAHGDTGNYTDWVAKQGWLPENPNQPVDRAGEVNSIYDTLFGRDATQSEIDTWGNQINANDWGTGEAVRSVFDAAHAAHGDAGNYTDWVYDQGWVDRPEEAPKKEGTTYDSPNPFFTEAPVETDPDQGVTTQVQPDMAYWSGTGQASGNIQRPNYGTPQQRPRFNFQGQQAAQPMSIQAAQTSNMNNQAKSTEWQGRLQGLLDMPGFDFGGLLQ